MNAAITAKRPGGGRVEDIQMSKVLYERRGAVALVTINRPAVHNALDPETLVLLEQTWHRIRDDDAVRVAVISGAGDKAFCAGADLSRLITLFNGARQPEDAWDERVVADPAVFETALLRDFDVTKPVVAALNGYTIAGGMELALGADLRIAAETARLGMQEVKWGLFPAGGATVRLPRQISEVRAMELLLTGERIDAQTALAWGLLNRVVPQGDVLASSLALAEKIAGHSPVAVRAIRRSLRDVQGLPAGDALALEKRISADVFLSEDAREGQMAFIEKRPPVFKGR
ncbi:3-hydroxypropionyl-coenzyme A dehydratase [Hyphomicrobiales bacterium]|nr:3-hydroxypropionyl-coenzyme A dehydratase [Hyphomicrobiales bacterium]CAH1686340.1 3-hydroxypropionyl-coenzyme A dehydratase [Hyphomicrobiales bacterium]